VSPLYYSYTLLYSSFSMSRTLLVVCLLALLVAAVAGENAISKLKAKVNAGAGAAPCDKSVPSAPKPRQFLDIRLPHVVDDYHPPVGGFNPDDIPSKEVDVAARKILREIQKAEAEAKANGDEPATPDPNGILSTEEHKALKQLLLDADILVRAASKSLAENGPIELAAVKRVATAAVKQATKVHHKPAAAKPAAPAAAKPAAPAAAKAPSVGKTLAAVPSPASHLQVRAAAPKKDQKKKL